MKRSIFNVPHMFAQKPLFSIKMRLKGIRQAQDGEFFSI